MKPRSCWIVYTLAVLAPFIAPIRCERMVAHVLPPADSAAAASPDAFKPLAVYRTTDSAVVPRGLRTFGSWIDSDEFQGTQETRWFAARARFSVLVCGYPSLAANRLELEFRSNTAPGVLRYTDANPGENWKTWPITLPAGATTFRLRGIDASSAPYGWLAFSEPFVDVSVIPRQLWPLLQLAAATCLSFTLIFGPGLVWMRRSARAPGDLVFAIVAGPLSLAALGLACWLLGGWLSPVLVARVGVGLLLAGLGWALCRSRSVHPLPAAAGTVVVVSVLLSIFAVAKANFSSGPAGELFGGTVSRTLEVGGHSDSRMSYHIVQLVAAHAGPFSAEAESHYSPWSFANRGPLAGLIATPVVLALGGKPAGDACNHPWQPFDPQGFAVYRITQIVLAALAAWAVFGAVAALLPTTWALLAATIMLLAPFFVHELYFTWPKLPTAAFVLLAFVLAHGGRPFAAGIAFGLGYLFHPLALLVLPFFGLGLLFRGGPQFRGWRRLAAPSAFGIAALLFVIPWMLLGRLAPLRTGAQMVFFDYFRLSDNQLISAAGPWWHARWENFANTFLPLHLFAVDRLHESINSVYGPSDPITQAGFLYWNTLPFALGLPAFVLLVAAIVAAARRAPGVVLVTFVLPTLLLIFYWGAADTGLMRHCGHVLFVTVIVLGVWSLRLHAAKWRGPSIAAFLHPACFAWRGLEVALMAFGPTLWHARPDWAGPLGWNDTLSLAIALTCLGASVILLARASAAVKHELSVSDPPARSLS